MNEATITTINEVIETYFKTNTEDDWVPAKVMMPALIKAGVFVKDEKNGLPLRKVFRELDKENALAKIPRLHAERAGENTYWYLVKEGATYVAKDPKDTGVPKGQQRRAERASSDQYYLLNICDRLLDQSASRQHKFGFLLGDMHKNDKTQSVLPVDAYYRRSGFVMEFLDNGNETQIQFGKPGRKTISGVDRAEQRKIYALRKRKALESKKIPLIEIDFKSFECTAENKLIRNEAKDEAVLKKILKKYLPST